MTQSKERIIYVNGDMVPESKAMISALDTGYRWGDAVYDVERTFGGEIFKLRPLLPSNERSALQETA